MSAVSFVGITRFAVIWLGMWLAVSVPVGGILGWVIKGRRRG